MNGANKLRAMILWGIVPLLMSLVTAGEMAQASTFAGNAYCVQPPFVSQSVPPMVMFEAGRDHKLYYEAYNDGVDLNGDGKIDKTYDHSIEYYGYFNPYKCYTHSGGSGNNDLFTPVATNTDRFCSSGQWAGNILNWLTMSRMDVLRKVMYGGQRSQDSNTSTVLNRAYIPQDAHSWGKEYTGRICYNSTSGVYKTMCVTNADCDSGYACTDKSLNLIGSAGATGGTSCSNTVTWGNASGEPGYKKMLVVRYPNKTGTYGGSHSGLMTAFDYTQFKTGFSPQFVDGFGATILDPSTDHDSNYTTLVVAEFFVANNKNGLWSFAIDGDDDVELEIRRVDTDALIKTSGNLDQIGWYGGHGACNCQTHTDTYNLAENTWYRLVVRHLEVSGGDGVKVWFKQPGASSWSVFGQQNGNPSLDVRSPNIYTSGASINTCTLLNTPYSDTDTTLRPDALTIGKPSPTSYTTTPLRHLFCNTTLSDGVPTSSPQAKTLIRMITNSNHRIWEWTSKERPVCADTFSDGSSATTNRSDYTMQVEVCKSGVGTLSEDNKFERCRSYGGTFNAATGTYSGGTYKPIGLFQKYGESQFDESGNSLKVCSKTMGKICNTDSDCGAGEGLCFDKSKMYFGFMTTTYTKNTSGGVLRKNPGPVSDEVNMNNGTQQTSENDRGNLIISMDRLKVIDFDYGSHSYSNCGWILDRPMNEGECKMWGNPIAEMMYESLRYFAGKGAATSAFTYSTTADSGVNLTKPAWGYKKGSDVFQPFEIFPSCSQPFLLVLSDVNTSFDSDQIPGSSYASFSEDAALPQLGLGEVQANGKTLLNDLLDTIGQTEGVDGHSWFIGESNGSTDFICTAKGVNAANGMHSVRGICPEEPTKKGSYYSAALAYYGKTKFSEKTGKSPVSTFVVALSSPFADIRVKVKNTDNTTGFVNVVPVGKSVYGSGTSKCLGYSTCALTPSSTTPTYYTITGCPTNAFCPTNSLVDFYMDDLRYDTDNTIIYAKYRINFEDVEQGADHDMDAIATYELCTQAAATAGYGSCGGTIDGLQVKVSSDYAAGSISQLLGFIISGTTADDTYLVVKDVDTSSGAISGLPTSWNKTFQASTSGAAGYLKNPLWYAAKWGGFSGSGKPDTQEKWDKDGDGLPDNYFPVSNPLQLDQQLENALLAILAKVSSGTAASILNNSEGSGANLLQAVFYPKKDFDDNTSTQWIGEMQNLWYYLDPFLNHTSIREDTNQNNVLNLKQDKIAQFYFSASESKTLVKLFSDIDGNGIADNTATPDATVDPDFVKSLWRAGRLLWQRNLTDDPRTIYTGLNSTAGNTPQRLINVDGSINSIVTQTATMELLNIPIVAGDDAGQTQRKAKATKLIYYLEGFDQAADADGTMYRPRKVTINSCGLTDSLGCTREWKLGDIISSTPKLVSTVKLNNYHLAIPTGYTDLSYKSFINSTTYQQRGMVFVGGNDGMLHAFKLGILKELNSKFNKAQMNNASGSIATASDHLGREEWAYIPKHMLPYLKYLTSPDYNHLYYIDRTPTIVDASIGIPATPSCPGDYSTCEKKTDGSTWRTVLIGGMGLGGSSKNSTDSCVTGFGGTCVKNPIDGTGYSSYFALDVTDPASPKTMWEFYGDTGSPGSLGYSLTGPSIIRIAKKDASGNPDNTKNGKWFAVFGSGPTGPIDTTKHEFKGESNQNLKLFIVDLQSGTLVTTIDTGIQNAFAGSLASSWIDADRAKLSSKGFYSDDAVYIGYTQKDTSTNTWTKGGVVRLLTRENDDPASSDTTKKWTTSILIDDVGPVTTSITKLQDRPNNNLWIYFGTGRYFYKFDDNSTTTTQKLYGIREPCYSTSNRAMKSPVAGGTVNDIDQNCSDKADSPVDQTWSATHTPTTNISNSAAGWSVTLNIANSNFLSERVITDPVASTGGAVYFTSFSPSSDVCKYGGESSVFALNYATGACPPCSAIQGKGLMQVSTGAFAEIDLKDSFCCVVTQTSPSPRLPPLNPNPFGTGGGALNIPPTKLPYPITGVPPTSQGFSLITNPPPAKKFLHVKEK